MALRLGQSIRKIHQIYEKTRAAFNQNGSIFLIDEDIQNLSKSLHSLQSSSNHGIKEKFELRELNHEIFQLNIKVSSFLFLFISFYFYYFIFIFVLLKCNI